MRESVAGAGAIICAAIVLGAGTIVVNVDGSIVGAVAVFGNIVIVGNGMVVGGNFSAIVGTAVIVGALAPSLLVLVCLRCHCSYWWRC